MSEQQKNDETSFELINSRFDPKTFCYVIEFVSESVSEISFLITMGFKMPIMLSVPIDRVDQFEKKKS